MLDQVVFHPTEGKVMVDATVTDTERRLRDGDPVLGWEGDPNMRLFVDLESGLYDVWTLDVKGDPCIAVERRPYCDARLIEDVIRADTRRFDVAGRVIAKNQAAQAAERAKDRARNEELADKLHRALMKDLGAHVGGLTRRLH